MSERKSLGGKPPRIVNSDGAEINVDVCSVHTSHAQGEIGKVTIECTIDSLADNTIILRKPQMDKSQTLRKPYLNK